MDTGTLIDVVARINAKHEHVCRTENILDNYTEGYLDALEDIMDYFQGAIEADVEAMESARENGE
jgi:hypothetical protein